VNRRQTKLQNTQIQNGTVNLCSNLFAAERTISGKNVAKLRRARRMNSYSHVKPVARLRNGRKCTQRRKEQGNPQNERHAS
jgi:hypothetical protein